MPEIKQVSIKHNEIMDYLMANPTIKLSDVASHFGMTQAWLSTVIHSDVFQTLLKSKQDIAFHHTILPLREKIERVAHQALDRVLETLPFETEVSQVAKVAQNALESLGFGAKPIGPGGNTYNFNGPVQVNGALRAELEEARALIGRKAVNSLPPPEVIIDGERAPIGIQSKDLARMGEAFGETSIPARATKADEAAKAGDLV